MENPQNINLKINEEKNNSYRNSELISISNKETDFKINSKYDNQLKLSNNEEPKVRTEDKLYGNDFIKCYLTNRDSCIKKIFCSRIKKMGNLYVYLFINNQPLIVLGNKNISLIIIYHVLIHITFIIFKLFIMNEVDVGMKYSLSALYVVSVFCHVIIFLINPGIPGIDRYSKMFLKSENYKKLKEEEQKDYYLCEECNILIHNTEKIEHCEDCNICVKQYDHHCYWTGKCITKRTIIFFYGFAFATLFYILWYFLIILYWLILILSKYNSKIKKFL
jgi:hypothetical protein